MLWVYNSCSPVYLPSCMPGKLFLPSIDRAIVLFTRSLILVCTSFVSEFFLLVWLVRWLYYQFLLPYYFSVYWLLNIPHCKTGVVLLHLSGYCMLLAVSYGYWRRHLCLGSRLYWSNLSIYLRFDSFEWWQCCFNHYTYMEVLCFALYVFDLTKNFLDSFLCNFLLFVWLSH